MFYVRPNQPYYAPRHSYPASSYYAQPEPEPYVSPDELARARYLQAMREQRAARKAYADALAERELRRMESQYGADEDEPYTPYGVPRTRRAPALHQPRYYEQPEEEDEEEGPVYGYDNWADALRARAREQERARALEQERAREIAAEHERQRLRAAQLAAEQERQRALAAAEEERRQAHAYKQAQAYADALAQKQMNTKPANRKLGRVTPDVRPTAPQEPSKPVRIQIRSRSTTPPRPAPTQSTPPTDAPPAAPEPKTALSAIATVESALSKLRETFSLPPQLDFKAPRELSFAKTNAPVRAYEYELGKLLEKLDEVESAGVAEIRKERKRVVEMVEGELGELERKIAEEWKKAHPEDEVTSAKPVDAEAMDVEYVPVADETELDPLPAAAELATPNPSAADSASKPPLEPEHTVDPMDVESLAAIEPMPAELSDHVDPPAAADLPSPTDPADLAEAVIALDQSAPSIDSSPAVLGPTPPVPPCAYPEPSTSPANASSDTAPSPDGMEVEPAPLAVDASGGVRISITQDAPASLEAQSIPVVDAQPIRITISSPSASEPADIPVEERSASEVPPLAPASALESGAAAQASPIQRTDEFEMV
ncbi:hypothetical protein AURDEDRAFT_145234 [Auricularia subglabra TFB-10046 SS5]|nr:hypothetical protein AURDEDRAFT_145234 [Auricularia subglabra TFB-10046 SS5]